MTIARISNILFLWIHKKTLLMFICRSNCTFIKRTVVYSYSECNPLFTFVPYETILRVRKGQKAVLLNCFQTFSHGLGVVLRLMKKVLEIFLYDTLIMAWSFLITKLMLHNHYEGSNLWLNLVILMFLFNMKAKFQSFSSTCLLMLSEMASLSYWICEFQNSVNTENKVNNRNTRTRCEICSKLTIKTPERRHWQLWTYFTPCPSVSMADFEHVVFGWGKVCWMNIALDELSMWVSAVCKYGEQS